MGLFLLGLGIAAAGPCAPEIAEFRTVVDLPTATQGTVEESYRFAVPESCTRVQLPRALDGMTVAGVASSVVTEGLLAREPAWEQRQMFVVSRRRVLKGGPFASAVQKPDFPIGTMSVEITSPATTRLSVWTDPTALVEVRRDRFRRYRASFPGGGLLAWSTHADWWAVGRGLDEVVKRKLAAAKDLGELGALVGMPVEEIVKRVSDKVAVSIGGAGWVDAAPAKDVLAIGRGSAAERALVLISVLRAAGYDAQPAAIRVAGSQPLSMSVAGLELLPDVAVYIDADHERGVWIDPRSSFSLPDFVPTGLRGSIALVPGDVPRRVFDHFLPDGRVIVESVAVVKENGAVEITADVRAEGAASQAVRDVLGPLSKEVRKQWLNDLLVFARPDVGKVRFQVYGVDDPTLPFGLSVEFREPRGARSTGSGLRASMPAVLATQLARVLPPNVEVRETLTVRGGGELSPFGVVPVEDPVDADLVISRSQRVDRGEAVLVTEALRPWRTSPRAPATEARLFEASTRAPQVLLFGQIDRTTARRFRSDENNTETRVIEALLWYEAGDDEEAERALRRVVRGSRIRTLVDVLRRTTALGELRPWSVVWDAAPDDHARLAIVHGLEAKHERREAWRRASQLVESPVDAVRVEALVTLARVQGERPPANVDEAAHRAWREPALLVSRAEKLASDLFGERGHPAVDVPVAEQLLLKGACDEAGPRIARVLDTTTNPRIRSVHAEWRACTGDRDVLPTLPRIVEDSGYDPTVIATVVRAYQRLGEHGEARRWSMLAAHIAGTDVELWMKAVAASVEAGDLRTAVYAARRASDLGPSSMNTTVPLQILATLAGEAEHAAIATKRSGYASSVESIPISMRNALTFVAEEQRLGLLRLRDDDVLRDEALLVERARRHLAIGDELGAVRDAAWLTTTYRSRLADAYAYVASSEQLWSTNHGEELARSIREPEVRKLRMEHALLTGTSDPVADARQLPDDAAAGVLRDAVDQPEQLRVALGWPEEPEPVEARVPEGFKEVKLLGVLPGVRGFSNRDAGCSLLVSSVVDRLPAPIDGVFELGELVDDRGRIRVYALDRGGAAAFAATRTVGSVTYWGVARSRQLARFAVEAGIAAQ